MANHLGQGIFHVQQPLLHRLEIGILAQWLMVRNPGVVHLELQFLLAIHLDRWSVELHGWASLGLGLDESAARMAACLSGLSSSGLLWWEDGNGLLCLLVLLHVLLTEADLLLG